MFITKHICEKMNGQIRIFSHTGLGTTFIVCIPVETSNETNLNSRTLSGRSLSDKSSPEQLDGLERKGVRAMILDDNPYNT